MQMILTGLVVLLTSALSKIANGPGIANSDTDIYKAKHSTLHISAMKPPDQGLP